MGVENKSLQLVSMFVFCWMYLFCVGHQLQVYSCVYLSKSFECSVCLRSSCCRKFAEIFKIKALLKCLFIILLFLLRVHSNSCMSAKRVSLQMFYFFSSTLLLSQVNTMEV